MNREIKFRAWDGKRMIYFQDLMIGIDKRSNNPYVFFQTDTFGGEVRLGKHEVMQFTGLHDKNGKEICEGDIISCEGGYEQNEKEDPCVVAWDNGSAQYVANETNGNYICPLHEFDIDEIIGNIYENSELIAKATA